MSKTNRSFVFLFSGLIFLLLFSNACSPDNSSIDTGGGNKTDELKATTGISEDQLETYKGELGIVIDARELVQKGYKPAKMEIQVNAANGNYSQTQDVDPYTVMSQIRLVNENLSAEAQAELKEGVEVKAKVLDASGNTITEETFSKVSFKSNPTPVSLTGSNLEDHNTAVYLTPDTPYYIQVLENDEPVKKAVWCYPDAGGGIGFSFVSFIGNDVSFTYNEEYYRYSFQAIPGTTNTYAIKDLRTGNYLRINRNWSFTGTTQKYPVVMGDLKWNFPDDFINGNTDARFVVKKIKEGVYGLESVQGEAIKLTDNGLALNGPNATPIHFRFVPMNIDWTVESIDTKFMQPILPAAKNGFAFNNRLNNCSKGTITQTIGKSETKETVTTVGWDETVSLSSYTGGSATLTMGMEVSGKFFGAGASYSAEVSGTYETSTTNTTEKSNWGETTGSTSQTFFTERTITVLPNSATMVYDAYQSYDNIKVNFVQLLRVRGKDHDTGASLTGDEIKTQFHFNGFKGVITEVGSDYIEVTIRGVATMDQIFEAKSDAQDVDPICN